LGLDSPDVFANETDCIIFILSLRSLSCIRC